MRHSTSIKKYIFSILTIILIFVVWQIISIVKNNELIYPSIWTTFKRIGELLIDKEFIITILLSFLKVIITVLICLIVSLLVAYLYYLLPSISYFIRPLITILKVAPFAAIAIYIIMAVDSKSAPYILTSFVVLPIMIESFVSSLNNVPREIDDDLRTLNISKTRKFFIGIIPLILSSIIVSILESFGLGFKTMIMGEYLCSDSDSIGGYLMVYKTSIDYPSILAMLVILVFIVFIMDLLIRLIGQKLKNKTN